MMNIFKKCLVSGFLVLFIGAASNVTVAAVAQIGMAQPINNTITHLDAALKAVDTNELEVAQSTTRFMFDTSMIKVAHCLFPLRAVRNFIDPQS